MSRQGMVSQDLDCPLKRCKVTSMLRMPTGPDSGEQIPGKWVREVWLYREGTDDLFEALFEALMRVYENLTLRKALVLFGHQPGCN